MMNLIVDCASFPKQLLLILWREDGFLFFQRIRHFHADSFLANLIKFLDISKISFQQVTAYIHVDGFNFTQSRTVSAVMNILSRLKGVKVCSVPETFQLPRRRSALKSFFPSFFSQNPIISRNGRSHYFFPNYLQGPRINKMSS
jgi:hypothetical protein